MYEKAIQYSWYPVKPPHDIRSKWCAKKSTTRAAGLSVSDGRGERRSRGQIRGGAELLGNGVEVVNEILLGNIATSAEHCPHGRLVGPSMKVMSSTPNFHGGETYTN